MQWLYRAGYKIVAAEVDLPGRHHSSVGYVVDAAGIALTYHARGEAPRHRVALVEAKASRGDYGKDFASESKHVTAQEKRRAVLDKAVRALETAARRLQRPVREWAREALSVVKTTCPGGMFARNLQGALDWACGSETYGILALAEIVAARVEHHSSGYLGTDVPETTRPPPEVLVLARAVREADAEANRVRGRQRNAMAKGQKGRALLSDPIAHVNYVITPKGLVDPDEVPAGWGLLELEGREVKVRVKAVATRLDDSPTMIWRRLACFARRNMMSVFSAEGVTWTQKGPLLVPVLDTGSDVEQAPGA